MPTDVPLTYPPPPHPPAPPHMCRGYRSPYTGVASVAAALVILLVVALKVGQVIHHRHNPPEQTAGELDRTPAPPDSH